MLAAISRCGDDRDVYNHEHHIDNVGNCDIVNKVCIVGCGLGVRR